LIDILIKSFNRPYYLDRCLYSIYKFVKKTDFNIVVLDDGTPEKYLQKILKKYPEVILKKSSFYPHKSKFTAIGKSPKIQDIPINLWNDAVKDTTTYFLLLEDDFWFSENFELNNLVNHLISKNGIFAKFLWLDNLNLIQNKKLYLKENTAFITPKIPFKNPNLYWLFFVINKYKFRKILKFLTIYSPKKAHSYYSIYSVAGVVFRKDYFLNLWVNNTGEVNENLQIFNALKFVKKSKQQICFARTDKEYLKTGFISSATNKFYLKSKCDMFIFNSFLNELWIQDKFDVLQNFPYDISEKYITTLLGEHQSIITPKVWSRWVTEFKSTYTDFGCKIE